MFYSSFFVTGILEEKEEYGQLQNDTPCLILWVTIDKPFFAGGNLDIDKTSIPITIIEKHAQKLGKLLEVGMSVAISGEIRTFDWDGLDGHSNEVSYAVIELIATRVLAVSGARINNFLKNIPE